MKKSKVSLVIEGGGFKSVFSAGVLDAFLVNQFNPFDHYIGVSSGAMCLSYYIANQYKIYYKLSKKVCDDPLFLSYKNAFSDQGYMNLKYLTQYAVKNNPLDIKNITDTCEDKKFQVVATNIKNGKPVYLQPNYRNIYRCLRATSSLPFFTKGSCKINDLSLMDGAWSDPIPVKYAVDCGADKVIVIRPNPQDYKIDGLNYFGMIAGYWWRENPKMSEIFLKEYTCYNKAVDFINKKHTNIDVVQICPNKFLKSTVVGASKSNLEHDYRCGVEKGLDFIEKFKNLFF